MVHSAMDMTGQFVWIECANIDDSLPKINATMVPVCYDYL